MKKDHYAILYKNEQRTEYTVFASTDLDTLGVIFARMLQFEDMFQTFPNMSCGIHLEKDSNYDPDLGAFRMDELQCSDFSKWTVLIDDIIRQYGHRLDSPRR